MRQAHDTACLAARCAAQAGGASSSAALFEDFLGPWRTLGPRRVRRPVAGKPCTSAIDSPAAATRPLGEPPENFIVSARATANGCQRYIKGLAVRLGQDKQVICSHVPRLRDFFRGHNGNFLSDGKFPLMWGAKKVSSSHGDKSMTVVTLFAGAASVSDDDDRSYWDDARFRARVTATAAMRGKTVREVCRSAGLAPDYLNKTAARSGRSIEAIIRIAKELGVSLIELIGDPIDHRSPLPADFQLSRLVLVTEIAAMLFTALGARREIPTGIDPTEIVSCILTQIERRDR